MDRMTESLQAAVLQSGMDADALAHALQTNRATDPEQEDLRIFTICGAAGFAAGKALAQQTRDNAHTA